MCILSGMPILTSLPLTSFPILSVPLQLVQASKQAEAMTGSEGQGAYWGKCLGRLQIRKQ
jgi:hypothetical protein